MSLYLVIGISLLFLAMVGASPKWEKKCYVLGFLILTAFLTFRFGQGTDWLAYNYIFMQAPKDFDLASYFYTKAVHTEFAWKLLNNAWKMLGLDFVSMSIVVSLIEMLLLNRFVKLYSPNKALSLLLVYPVVYLTYFFSSFRQGLVIAVFLGVMIKLLEERKIIAYCVLVALLCTIHSMSLVLIIPLLVSRVSLKALGACLGVCAVVGIALCFLGGNGSIYQLLGISYTNSNPSLLAIIYRSLMGLLVYLMYSSCKVNMTPDLRDLSLLIKIYISGLSIYFLFMSNDLVASRLAAPFLALEIAVIPLLIKHAAPKTIAPLVMVIVLVVSVMTVKNLDSYIDQGSYYQSVSVWTYPYINIFNKDSIYLYTNNAYLSYL